jgi:hypothetical protein
VPAGIGAGVAVRRKFGDRRGRPRFDVVGDLWGTLDVLLRLPLRDVGPGGALVRSHMALVLDSVHKVTLTIAGEDFTMDAKVRHVRNSVGAGGEQNFLIGVEFLSVHPALVSQLARAAVSLDAPPAEV